MKHQVTIIHTIKVDSKNTKLCDWNCLYRRSINGYLDESCALFVKALEMTRDSKLKRCTQCLMATKGE